MKKEKLTKMLLLERDRFTNKSFDELNKIVVPLVYEIKLDSNKCNIEVDILEKNEKYVHISMAIDDRTLTKAISPISTSFIVHSDGRIEK